MSMKNSNERIWSWKQADGSLLKVVSNYKKGTITVINNRGKILLKKENLSFEQIKIIEEHFLDIVTKEKREYIKQAPKFDPMIS
jgi:hypothetical protein